MRSSEPPATSTRQLSCVRVAAPPTKYPPGRPALVYVVSVTLIRSTPSMSTLIELPAMRSSTVFFAVVARPRVEPMLVVVSSRHSPAPPFQ